MAKDKAEKHTCTKCGKEKDKENMYKQDGDKYCCKKCCDAPEKEEEESLTCEFC